jgi:hypothetical protein
MIGHDDKRPGCRPSQGVDSPKLIDRKTCTPENSKYRPPSVRHRRYEVYPPGLRPMPLAQVTPVRLALGRSPLAGDRCGCYGLTVARKRAPTDSVRQAPRTIPGMPPSRDSSSVQRLRINEKRYWRQRGQCGFGEINRVFVQSLSKCHSGMPGFTIRRPKSKVCGTQALVLATLKRRRATRRPRRCRGRWQPRYSHR